MHKVQYAWIDWNNCNYVITLVKFSIFLFASCVGARKMPQSRITNNHPTVSPHLSQTMLSFG
jgi:hypothetical protein